MSALLLTCELATIGKKIKERMQFLESKAAGEDGKSTKKSPKANSNPKKAPQAHQRRRSSPVPSNNINNNTTASLAAPHAVHHPFTPPMNPEDQPFFPSPSPPASSPPAFSAYQSSYSPPSDNGFYSTHPVTTWMGTAALTATTAAPTLPSMNHFSDASAYNSKGNESMSFASYGDYSLGVPATASPYDSNPHVSSHHHQHHQNHHNHHNHQVSRSSTLSSSHHDSALLPPVSTFPSYGGSDVVSSSSSLSLTTPVTGHLAAPDLYRSRYPPPPPARV